MRKKSDKTETRNIDECTIIDESISYLLSEMNRSRSQKKLVGLNIINQLDVIVIYRLFQPTT